MLRVTQFFTCNLLGCSFCEFTILLIAINYKSLIVNCLNLYGVVKHNLTQMNIENAVLGTAKELAILAQAVSILDATGENICVVENGANVRSIDLTLVVFIDDTGQGSLCDIRILQLGNY